MMFHLVLNSPRWSEATPSNQFETNALKMEVLVEIPGDGVYEVVLDDTIDPTFHDLLAELNLSSHEVAVLVDGRPVPETNPVTVNRVTVLKMIQGG